MFNAATTYASLPERFFARVTPEPVASPVLIRFNRALAAELGLDVEAAGWAEILSGNVVPPNATPISMAYAAHQFGQFVPTLGDGRAILLGEVLDANGVRRDIQLKGAGPTPFSRRGDGRSALGPVLREYIVSEAMFALGIPATRALAAVATGETVYRERGLPGGVFTRVAASHIRVGTFQFFAARQDTEALRTLSDYVIARHYPDIDGSSTPYLDLLHGVIARHAALVARWMHIGFIHGVMNTDNTAISGETIDFGPCAFMDGYDPAKVFSSIDRMGRYAYNNQPGIAQWNMARLAEAMLPLLHDDPDEAVKIANDAVIGFAPLFQKEWLDGMRAKIGLKNPAPDDLDLIQSLLDLMHQGNADFTIAFRSLADAAQGTGNQSGFLDLFENRHAIESWLSQWQSRTARDDAGRLSFHMSRADAMRAVNPAIIPRNHRIEEVIVSATEHSDFEPFNRMVDALATPYAEPSADSRLFIVPPRQDELVTRTFCGT